MFRKGSTCNLQANHFDTSSVCHLDAQWEHVNNITEALLPGQLKKYCALNRTLGSLKIDSTEIMLLSAMMLDRCMLLQASFKMDVFEAGPIEGLCGFFDVQFRGSPENPADYDVLLSTAPDPTGATHWGQQSFVLHPSVACAPGEMIKAQFQMQITLMVKPLILCIRTAKVRTESALPSERVPIVLSFHVCNVCHLVRCSRLRASAIEMPIEEEAVVTGDHLVGDITVIRKKENHRLMEVKMDYVVEGKSQFAQISPRRQSFYHIE